MGARIFWMFWIVLIGQNPPLLFENCQSGRGQPNLYVHYLRLRL